MTITGGTRLGPYEVATRIGAGGMGEVWKARDTRLDRSVAIKVLPDDLARDEHFKLRFEREAKIISQLSHPNICTLFDVGEGFLVMELLDGETLAERIARGPLPMADVFRFGIQIAEALGKAHRMGVVHRDLKPANVMLTKTGAKLLDFGMAKPGAGAVTFDSATQQRRQPGITEEGTILGTFQYMAPEQLEGGEADARTDIFALGALLYEMATGHPAFESKSTPSLIAQILRGEPKPLREVQPLTPLAFEHIVTRCLNKDPDERWQSATDVAEDLRWATVNTVGPEQKTRSIAPWAVAAGILVAALITVFVLWQRTPKPRVIWSDVTPPQDVRLAALEEGGGSAISPDGSRVIFVAFDKSAVARLYVREIRSGAVRPVPATEGATYPFWSPDSRSFGFFADGKLKRMNPDGTQLAVLASDVDGRGGTWNADGTIVFAGSSTSGLSRIRATGGQPEAVTEMSGEQSSLRFPWFLPDGKHFLYVAMGGRDRGIHIASLDGKVRKKLIDNYESGIFSGESVVFLREGALFAQHLDLDEMEVRGEPAQIASNVSGKRNGFANSGLSVSAAGDLLFLSEFAAPTSLVWRDRKGEVLQSFPSERMFYEPAFSPDEKQIVASSDNPLNSLWVVDVERGRARQLRLGLGLVQSPNWSRDGKRITFQTNSKGKPAVAALTPSGGTPQILATPAQTLYPEVFSPDDKFLVLIGTGSDGKDLDLWSMNLADRAIRPLVTGPGNQVRLQFSPDGRFISYNSDETGRPEIFVQTWPLSDSKWQVTTSGGSQAYWRSDGNELIYLGPDGKIMSVAVEGIGTFGDPAVLFQTSQIPVSITGTRNQYLVTRDAQRFFLPESVSTTPAHLTMVVNFPRLLEKER